MRQEIQAKRGSKRPKRTITQTFCFWEGKVEDRPRIKDWVGGKREKGGEKGGEEKERRGAVPKRAVQKKKRERTG